jgi:hypothetical protein
MVNTACASDDQIRFDLQEIGERCKLISETKRKKIMDDRYSIAGVLGLKEEVFRMELCGVSEPEIILYLVAAYGNLLDGVRESMISALAARRMEKLTEEALEACAGQGKELNPTEDRELIGETVKRLASQTEPLFKQAVVLIMEDANYFRFDA